MPGPVAELTAASLVEELAGIDGVRRTRAAPGFTAAVLLAQMEVAAAAPADEEGLRRLWRQRKGGGATPLVLIADTRVGQGIEVIGPLDADMALRVVDSTALHRVLARIATLPRLEAVRELADELSRLDRSGLPGVRLRELLTLHTLDARLRRDGRWGRAVEAVKSIPVGADWQHVLRGLGYELERRPRAGYLLKTADGRRVAVVHPKAAASDLSRLDADGRPPEGKLLNDCRMEGVRYGVLAHEARIRLFDAATPTGAAATRYIELDAATLQPDDRGFLALLGPDYLADGGLAQLQEEAIAFGADLRRRLDETLRQDVLPALAHGLGIWAATNGMDSNRDSVRAELERASLTLVFRCLFLLYAESAGYLPMDNRLYRAASLSTLVQEAHETRGRLSVRSTSLWDRLTHLVRTMRSGNPAWNVPAYNGDLFDRDGFEGAATLERVSIADPDVAAMLIGLGLDRETGRGIDYSTLAIGHLGHIYEGLLSLSLSVAATPLRYDPRRDQYIQCSDGEAADVPQGALLWQTHEGGRKGGGVYYTPETLVRHLVTQTVRPAFTAHLVEIADLARTDPAAAAQRLLDFAVLDPACGSAHFLVVVLEELADQVVTFLAATPLPQLRIQLDHLRSAATAATHIDDVVLIRRLVLKHCVFGVDVSPMGAEVAKLSLWLASFVPGLSLAYLGRNVIVGNSLIGVARPESVSRGYSSGRRRRGRASEVREEPERSWLELVLETALAEATDAVAAVAASDDRTPDEVAASETADQKARAATAGLEAVFDLWTAESFGVSSARQQVELHGADIVRGSSNGLVEAAQHVAREHRFLHWPLAFPRLFSRERPGFDVVVGNPPWEKVVVKEDAFLSLFRPGLNSLPDDKRIAASKALLEQRPDVADRMQQERARAEIERDYFAGAEYPAMPGDPDLYKFFCVRYQTVAREGGRLGVVLPRTAFNAEGSRGFRTWLFEHTSCTRLDFLLNRGSWMFDTHPQYTIALIAAERMLPPPGHITRVVGTAAHMVDWERQRASSGISLSPEMFGPSWTPPLLRDESEATVFRKVRQGTAFPFGPGGRSRAFPVSELHETHDRSLWQDAQDGWRLWKGESFDQYAPRGTGERLCPPSDAAFRKVHKPRAGAGSLLAESVPLPVRVAAVRREVGRARVAFRDVARATDSRTVRACLVPRETFLTHAAPYLAFIDDDDVARAACLGVMNSLPFDWDARRFVEINLSFFILEGLVVPDLDDAAYQAVAAASARLSCVDERFADFARSAGVECGPLTDEERLGLLADIDARVAHAWHLTDADLGVIFRDFTFDAVSEERRTAVRKRLAALSSA